MEIPKGWGDANQKPSVGGVWIFSGTTHYKRCLRTISPSFLTTLCGNWQAKCDLIDSWKPCFAKLSNENIYRYCEVQVSPNTFTGFLATLAPLSNGLVCSVTTLESSRFVILSILIISP